MFKFITLITLILLTSYNLYSNEKNLYANIKLINKVSGKNYIYSIKLNKDIKHKNLNISLSKCIENNKSDNEYAAYILIKEIKKNRLLFNAWIFSKNISISQFSHPIYAIKLLNCKNI